MVIERRESYLFGLIKRKPVELAPGTQETLDRVWAGRFIRERRNRIVGRSIIVESPDKATIRYHGNFLTQDTEYYKDEINSGSGITAYPSFKDILLTKERKYTWRE
ncbi:MAG: hypothetical protein A2857_00760 [Candidatus Levybacteria bacterium RIFCSPHIGHO2_01_FULL_36_15]|nr:MAG: hypothetical protein A2857_00760 [Candidatus Levybacteria bacterium RIFCSPHIGHO2_01_FULL_36_15]